jgi:L-glyceraldehyde 3-phosphate reductase
MALAWVLRHPGVTSALVGANSTSQIEEDVAALKNVSFTEEELRNLDGILKG